MTILENALKLKQEIANTMGLPGIAVDWLRGETEEEIKEDAKKLLVFMGLKEKTPNIKNMDPAEIRTNANKLLEKEAEKMNAETIKGYQNAATVEEVRENWKKKNG